MRRAAEERAWHELEKSQVGSVDLDRIVHVDGAALALDQRCLVLAGFNGAGKSRALGAIGAALGEGALLIRLHELCEQVQRILRSRTDVAQMEDELGSLPIDAALVAHVQAVIGRDYESVRWFALELESTEPGDGESRLPKTDDGLLVPHFRVEHGGQSYASLDMGLGEFSVHLLFWLLWHFRESPGLVVLLDEPDSYLPPRTRLRLLSLLLDLARKYNWQLVLTSHSDELINEAYRHDALVVARRDAGEASFDPAVVHGYNIVRELVARPPCDLLLFCEDEAAYALLRAVLSAHAEELLETSVVIWKDGDGYLRKLAETLPRTHVSPIRFAFVFDGDLRSIVPPSDGTSRWPVLFLPTDEAPDALMRSAKADVTRLAEALGADELVVSYALDALQGLDDHDWVNGICERFGFRPSVLAALASLWVEDNGELARTFGDELRAGLSAPK